MEKERDISEKRVIETEQRGVSLEKGILVLVVIVFIGVFLYFQTQSLSVNVDAPSKINLHTEDLIIKVSIENIRSYPIENIQVKYIPTLNQDCDKIISIEGKSIFQDSCEIPKAALLNRDSISVTVQIIAPNTPQIIKTITVEIEK